jgi:selenide, water dikinase
MKAAPDRPVTSDLVLVGGGHAHVYVLRAFAMKPVPGVRVTLVARDLETPYSGMLPGYVAGLYSKQACHIDLQRLARAGAVRLIHAQAVGLDRLSKRLLLKDRPSMAYDLISIDVGITPDLSAITGAAEHAVAVKPIGDFIDRWDALLARALRPDGPRRFAVVGGGAAGVELAFAIAARLRSEAAGAGLRADAFSVALYSAGPLLGNLNAGVVARIRRRLAAQAIACHENARVTHLAPGSLTLAGGAVHPVDAVLVSTQARPPPLVAASDLAKDAEGFLAIGPTLQSLDDPFVFAAGDCAGMVASPREKAGVFAVRQGPPLADNLRRRLRHEPMRDFRPQKRFLTLLGTGNGEAVGGRGRWLAFSGRWVWRWKQRIDWRWMAMMQDRSMLMPEGGASPSAGDDHAAMRCGGCAAKVGPGPLGRALRRLGPGPAHGVAIGLDAPDDAAVIALPSGDRMVQTVDYFRAFIDDPWLFGRIAAAHALNDVFAMGGQPTHALAIATVPHAASDKVEEDLFQLLAGARATLDREGVALVGGHSGEGEGEALALGFSVTGPVGPGQLLRKGGLRQGDALILTKPIGTGVIFAADMRAQAPAGAVEAALAGMLASNREPARVLSAQGAQAATDVTGFGLAGHLAEMAEASGCAVDLAPGAIPLYPGAAALARQGFSSSLVAENRILEERLRPDLPLSPQALALLFDPQTSGGLLAGVPGDRAPDCLAALQASGAPHAAIIGQVRAQNDSAPGAIHLTDGADWPP